MKKQNKIVAVASAAALLAIGASMTSFAATGWTEEDGTWYYYDKDGNRVTDEWKKSGENWYWLDGEEDGAMAVDKLIEDDSNWYYVDSNGAMVRNQWVKVVNEDQDDDTDPAEYRYYYMQANGKAHKAPTSGNVSTKTIDGKKYAFDDEGKMLYGWVEKGNATLTSFADDADAWATGTNMMYFGSWDDGAMKTGWQLINVYAGASGEYTQDSDEAGDNVDKWFWFNANGTKYEAGATDVNGYKTKTINKAKYAFNQYGVMKYKWVETKNTATSGSVGWSGASDSNLATTNNANVAANWAWFSDPESGARVTKGWFKVVPSNSFDAKRGSDNDDTAKWYYSDGSGNLYTNVIKKIGNKYYAFDERGAMMSGLVLMSVNSANGQIVDIADSGVDSDELADLKKDAYKAGYDYSAIKNSVPAATGAGAYSLYYFGDNEDTDGAMKTGMVNVNIDGNSYAMKFSDNGGTGRRGAGFTGVNKKIFYKYGIKMAASSDDKYRMVDNDSVYGNGTVGSYTYSANPVLNTDAAVKFEDTQAIMGANTANTGYYGSNNEVITYYDFSAAREYSLIGTDGKLKKNATGVKDGNDWYFWTDAYGRVLYYADSNKLKSAKDSSGNAIVLAR